MGTKGTKEYYLEDVAVKLFYSLHSSENENIISSLLTASLNESSDFMKSFLSRAGMHGNCNPSKFSAEANVSLPEELRGTENSPHRYKRPDVFLLHKGCQQAWDALKETKGRSSASSLANLRSIFIEVKHTNLSPKDMKKYIIFNTWVKKKCDENTVKFVIISSHTRRGLEQKKVKTWCGLRKEIGESQHILLSDIHHDIDVLKKRRTNIILHVFKTYLVLVLGPTQVEDKSILERLWRDIIHDYSEDSSSSINRSLKREIVESIEWLVKINAFVGGHWGTYKKDDKINELTTIKIDRSKNKVTLIKGRSDDKLEVEFDDQSTPIVFDLSYSYTKSKIDHIVTNMMSLSRQLSDTQYK